MSTDDLSPQKRDFLKRGGTRFLCQPQMPDPPWGVPIAGKISWAYQYAEADDNAETTAWRHAIVEPLRAERARVQAESDADALDDETRQLRIRREAQRTVNEEEAAEAAEPRIRRTAAEYAAIPRPQVVMEDVLPAAPALLGGPEAAGKSLLARDWAFSVATGSSWQGHDVPERRPVLYVMDEGMHDFGDRWSGSPLWEVAKDTIFVIDGPVNLLSTRDVDAVISEYADVRPGMVIFDTIYGMGMPDDMGVKEVAPVINSMKRISAEWTACTLAIGHAGHNGERRFRGSSMWRQRTDVDWHMADLMLTCERSKIAGKGGLGGRYELDYPHVKFLSPMEAVTDEGRRVAVIVDDLARNPCGPKESMNHRAQRLAPKLGIGDRQVRRYIQQEQKKAAEGAS